MFKTTSLRQFSEPNNKWILNKSNKLTLLASASLLTLAACGETTTTGEVTVNKIVGTTGDDTINGTEGRDSITSLAGDDVIYGSEGNDNIDGGDGYDGVSYENSETAVYVYLDGNVSGTANFNGFYLDTHTNIEAIIGSDFNDTIYGDAADNGLGGGDGNDKLYGLDGDDNLVGGNGNDTISGDTGRDTIDGGDGNDTLSGGDDNDIIYGGAGDDTIIGGEGADEISGGNGVDWVIYNGAAVTVVLDGVTLGIGGEAEDDVLTGIENIRSTLEGDDLTGNASDNILRSDAGADTLKGLAGDNTLEGGTGVDIAIIDADSVNYIIDLVENKIEVEITRSSIISHDYLDSIETLRLNGTDLDVKDLWTDPNSDASTVFGGDIDAFEAWLGEDSGYNYEGL